jgi:hypothetical protein
LKNGKNGKNALNVVEVFLKIGIDMKSAGGT